MNKLNHLRQKNSNFIIIRLVFFLSILISNLNAQEVVRILAIGNSFSQDAVENYLYDLAKADNVQLVIGHMYIGGCTLQTHWKNAQGDLAAYSYRKIVNGRLTTKANQKLSTTIKDENWDIITFQQVSGFSGVIISYFPELTNLKQYVSTVTTNPQVQFALHQTWAYASNSTHVNFANYNNNQDQMFRAIVTTVDSAAVRTNISIVIPAGTAIQNGRTSYIGDSFCRDGYHLDLVVGRYTAACTWYEKLLHRSVVGNTYKPPGMSQLDADIAQNAAHYAVIQPNDTTSLAHYAPDPMVLKSPVNIDFGSTASPSPWNNFISILKGASLARLTDIKGNKTNVSITINDSFGGINRNGPTSTSTTLNLPSTATSDSFWCNAAGVFSGKSERTGGFLIAGLNPEQVYNFHMFAGRSSTTDNRETVFTVIGNDTMTAKVDAANNTSKLASVLNLFPAANGTVSLKLTEGPSNVNDYKFFYINTLTIEPGSLSGVKSVSKVSFHLYPNPMKDKVILKSEQVINQVAIFEVSGKKVFAVDNINSNNTELDLSGLMNGYYLLRVNGTCCPLIKSN